MNNVRIMVLLTCFLLIQSLVHPCGYILDGDFNGDCKVNLEDLAKLAFNWLVDCTEDPNHSSCVPLPLSSGDLVISEIMMNPQIVSDTNGEWFEIYNTIGVQLDLKGLVIVDGAAYTHTISGSLMIDAYGRLVIGRNADPAQNGGVTVDYVWSDLSLSNTSDSIAIVSPDTVLIDEVIYDSGSWPVASSKSMSLDPSAHDALSNDSASNWCQGQSVYGDGDYGTPGSANDSCY